MNWIGRTLGRCQIESEIGQGRTSIVYRAFQPHLERWVAVKILKTSDLEDQTFLERFRREARAIAALRHPNILTIYDYGEESGVAYIVMEYVAGGTLKTLMPGRPMSWPEAAVWFLPICQALAFAHEQGVVHRDIKPANILMPRPDWPLLADFGLAKLVGRARGLTQPGLGTGTPAYFSPEQAIGIETDHRSDIYSLGVLLYEMLTAHLPFESANAADMLLRRLREPPLPPSRLVPHIHPHLEAVIMAALARQAGDRPNSVHALIQSLTQIPTQQIIPAAPSTAPSSNETTMRLGGYAAAAGPYLLVTTTGARIPISWQQRVIIGRADLQVASQPFIDLSPVGGAGMGISRQHACLTPTPDGWTLQDLHSTNGTCLNNIPLMPDQPFLLCSGDVIRMGQLTLIFYSS